MPHYRWFVYALIGACLAAVVSVANKKALNHVDVVIAITVQSLCMLLTLLVLASVLGRWAEFANAPKPMLALTAASGVAAGLAWFFGYRALQLSSVAQATPVDRLSLAFAVILALVFLKERPTLVNWIGICMMLVGALCVARSNGQ